jgi:hypothetical protein
MFASASASVSTSSSSPSSSVSLLSPAPFPARVLPPFPPQSGVRHTSLLLPPPPPPPRASTRGRHRHHHHTHQAHHLPPPRPPRPLATTTTATPTCSAREAWRAGNEGCGGCLRGSGLREWWGLNCVPARVMRFTIRCSLADSTCIIRARPPDTHRRRRRVLDNLVEA